MVQESIRKKATGSAYSTSWTNFCRAISTELGRKEGVSEEANLEKALELLALHSPQSIAILIYTPVDANLWEDGPSQAIEECLAKLEIEHLL
jgi:hypothetical protein